MWADYKLAKIGAAKSFVGTSIGRTDGAACCTLVLAPIRIDENGTLATHQLAQWDNFRMPLMAP